MIKLTESAKLLQNQVLETIHRFTKGDTIFDVLKPFIIACRFMLLTPYNFSVKSGEYLTFYNTPLLLIIACIGTLLARCIYVVIVTRETVVGHFHGTILFKIGDLFRIYSNLFTIIVIALSIFTNKHLFSVIMTLLSDIDKNFTLLSVDKHYERIKYKPFIGTSVLLVVCILSIIINDILASSWDSRPTHYLWIVLFIPNTTASFYMVLYCTGVLLFDYNLKMLNEELHKMTKNKLYTFTNNIYNIHQLLKNDVKKNIVLKSNKDLQLERITIIWTIYDAVCDGASNLNRLFGLRILTITGVSFVSLVFNCFFVWSVYASITQGENTVKNYTFLIYCIPEIVFRAANLAIPVHLCSSLKQRVNPVHH